MSTQWYYVLPGTQEKVGPVDDAAFKSLTLNGTLTADTLVWQNGWPDWMNFSKWQASANEVPAIAVPIMLGNQPLALVPAPAPVQAKPAEPERNPLLELCSACRKEVAHAFLFDVGSRRICYDCKKQHDLTANPRKRHRDPDEGWFGRHLLKLVAIGLVLAFLRIGLMSGFRFGWTSSRSATADVSKSSPFATLDKSAPAEPWVRKPQDQWPAIALANDATFKGHTPLKTGTAFLLQLKSGDVAAITALHFLGEDGGVTPEIERKALDREIVTWNLIAGGDGTKPIAVDRSLWILNNEWMADAIALHVSTPANSLSAQPLKLRTNAPKQGETVYVLGAPRNGQSRQTVLRAKVEKVSAIALGTSFSANLDQPSDLSGFGGAPIIDDKGHLVAMMTGVDSWDDEGAVKAGTPVTTFSGELASSLR